MNKKELEEHRRLLLELCKDYKRRIDKAIEYISQLKCNADEKCFDNLLEILGDDKNE